MSDDDVEFVDIRCAGRPVRIEHRWIAPRAQPAAGPPQGGRPPAGEGAERARGPTSQRPLLVFLHEGLGSLSMWKDYPAQLCEAADLRGLVYSRPGYGRSTPREAGERWGTDFMHRQAFELLPALLEALRVDQPPWLFGHSDGGSIALLYASRFVTAGLVVVAPHITVEQYGLASIRKARNAFRTTDLRSRLARYHADPDSAFWGWNDIWLDPAFEAWTIERELASIRCPLLAVQGEDDKYGTLEQIRGIARRVAQTRVLVLPHCGHSPHRDRPEALTLEAAAFVHRHLKATPQETAA